MKLKISLFTVWSAAIFVVFNAFLIYLVDGLICKIALGSLYVSVIAFAIGLEFIQNCEDDNQTEKNKI